MQHGLLILKLEHFVDTSPVKISEFLRFSFTEFGFQENIGHFKCLRHRRIERTERQNIAVVSDAAAPGGFHTLTDGAENLWKLSGGNMNTHAATADEDRARIQPGLDGAANTVAGGVIAERMVLICHTQIVYLVATR